MITVSRFKEVFFQLQLFPPSFIKGFLNALQVQSKKKESTQVVSSPGSNPEFVSFSLFLKVYFLLLLIVEWL